MVSNFTICGGIISKGKYQRQIESIGERVDGDIICEIGFGNFYPKFSPDGGKIAYISNKENDYFSISALYLLELKTRKELKIADAVSSSISWSADGRKIFIQKGRGKTKTGKIFMMCSFMILN
jgi:Tol biopolymer transport system component